MPELSNIKRLCRATYAQYTLSDPANYAQLQHLFKLRAHISKAAAQRYNRKEAPPNLIHGASKQEKATTLDHVWCVTSEAFAWIRQNHPSISVRPINYSRPETERKRLASTLL